VIALQIGVVLLHMSFVLLMARFAGFDIVMRMVEDSSGNTKKATLDAIGVVVMDSKELTSPRMVLW